MVNDTTTVNVIINCDGKFIVDSDGIRSLEPIELNSSSWENNTLTLKGPNNNNGNNIVISGYNGDLSNLGFLGNMFGGTNKISFGSNMNVGAGETISIDGVTYRREGSSTSSPKKDFELRWRDKGVENPVLGSADISSKVELHVLISLDDDCDIDCSGAGKINIYGNNPGTSLTTNISGAGNVRGQGPKSETQCIIRKMSAHISGAGNISGFHATKNLKAKVSGAGNINLTHDDKCVVTKNKSGMGNLNIYPL